MEKVDFKKRDKLFYQARKTPVVLDIPTFNFLMVDGQGDPNEPDGAYSQAVGVLYALSYQIKMGKDRAGYYDYVVPPLESLWQMADGGAMDYAHKEKLHWTAMLRQPEFVDEDTLAWAKAIIRQKKGLSTAGVRLVQWTEGLCTQLLHVGGYDDEPVTIKTLHEFIRQQNLALDETRKHHEIYLSNPRRTASDKCKTLLRLPVKRLTP